eukprot:jgi/Mesen1/2710/ME000168S01776
MVGIVGAAKNAVGFGLGSKHEPLWENEGPVGGFARIGISGCPTQSSPGVSQKAVGGHLDVKIVEICGLESVGSLWGLRHKGTLNQEAPYIEVQLGNTHQGAFDEAVLLSSRSRIAAGGDSKLFRFELQEGQPQTVQINVYKRKDGRNVRHLAAARVLLWEVLKVGFHNITLTLVSRKRQLAPVLMRLAMVYLPPISPPPEMEAVTPGPEEAKLRHSRSHGSRRVLNVGDDEADSSYPCVIAVPDTF